MLFVENGKLLSTAQVTNMYFCLDIRQGLLMQELQFQYTDK